MTIPFGHDELGLRFAQAQGPDVLFDVEPAVRAFDPNLLAYLESTSFRRAATMLRYRARVPLHRSARWSLIPRRSAMLALLLLLCSDGARTRVRGRRLSYGTVGARLRVRFIYDARRARFTVDQPSSWVGAIPAPAATVTELLLTAAVTRQPVTHNHLDLATALVGLLPHVSASHSERAALLLLRHDAVRRGLVPDTSGLGLVTFEQLITLHILGTACRIVPTGRLLGFPVELEVRPEIEPGRTHVFRIDVWGSISAQA